MVFEYMDHDLTGLMDTPTIRFTESHVKCYMIQLLKGLEYCHSHEVLHRDIKGSNLLIDNNGNLKIADFGLARSYGEQGRKYTNRVITLWYRPPELLLGANEYGPSVDMWSVGCLLAELLTRKPLFPGKDEAEQLDLIFQVMGTPSEQTWPRWRSLPQARMVSDSRVYVPQLEKRFAKLAAQRGVPCTQPMIELLSQMLMLDPAKRISAADALAHKWFQEQPYACRKDELPTHKLSTHEFQAKRRRQASHMTRMGGSRGQNTRERDGRDDRGSRGRDSQGRDGRGPEIHRRGSFGRDRHARSESDRVERFGREHGSHERDGAQFNDRKPDDQKPEVKPRERHKTAGIGYGARAHEGRKADGHERDNMEIENEDDKFGATF